VSSAGTDANFDRSRFLRPPRPVRRDPRSRVAIVTCGALVVGLRGVLAEHDWSADIYAIDALYHLRPERIPEAARALVHEIRDRYEEVILLYGDCGTRGELDQIIDELGATRPPGMHCYQMLLGDGYRDLVDRSPGAFFLTPWLVKNWRGAVLQPLGLLEHPELRDHYFAHITHVVYIDWPPTSRLLEEAHAVAAWLERPLTLAFSDGGAITSHLERIFARLAAGEAQTVRQPTGGGRARTP
jgi:uncharacterized protein DUF1638